MAIVCTPPLFSTVKPLLLFEYNPNAPPLSYNLVLEPQFTVFEPNAGTNVVAQTLPLNDTTFVVLLKALAAQVVTN